MQSEVILHHGGVYTRLCAVRSGVIRVTHTRREAFLNRQGPSVICMDRMQAEIHETDRVVCLGAGSIMVQASRQSGALTFRNAAGEVLLREPDKRPHTLQEKPVYLHSYEGAQVKQGHSVDGARAWAEPSKTWLDRTAYECRQSFVFDEEEGLYGLGSHEEGYGNLRGKSRILYQHNMKAVVPVLVSTKGWGVLFNMGCMMAFHDDEEGSYLWADCADELDWYFFYGDGSYASLMENYRALTGPTPMLPRYALGYIQSKERYVDAEEMLSVAGEYRRRGIPLDMIVLDWQSWPQNQWGWKTFDRTRFPDPAGFISKLHDQQVKLMISIWPSMQGEENRDRREMLESGCMLGNRLIYNAFDAQARQLYWKQAKENLFAHGVDAWWCDCTEPFESDWKGAVKPEAFSRARMNTDEAKHYLDPAQINLYSLYHSQGIYEGQRAVTDEKRVCNLTRSSYAGQHRYGTVTWSGDVSATWEVLRRHIPEGLNFCASGEAYWSADIGAFFPGSNAEPWFFDGDFNEGVADLGYRELFVRWAQYGALLPMMRAHGTGTPREIWRFGEAGEPFYDAIEKAIRLRYSLVPFLYTLMAEIHRTGLGMMRHPALVFPADQALRHVDDQIMLGDVLLAKPVTHPMYYLPHSEPVAVPDEWETVYLPAGHDWFDLHTGQCHAGGQTITAHAPLDVLPLYVRAGTILPWGAQANATAEQAALSLEIMVFPGADGAFTLYDDAGDGYGYERGECERIPMTWNDAEGVLTIGARRGSFAGMCLQRILRVRRAGGKAVEVCYTGTATAITL